MTLRVVADMRQVSSAGPGVPQIRMPETCAIGRTVSVACLGALPDVEALMITLPGCAVAATFTANWMELEPAGTMMLGGTVAPGLELPRVTTVPEAGDADTRATVAIAVAVTFVFPPICDEAEL